jgi:transcription antitermination factor NusG
MPVISTPGVVSLVSYGNQPAPIDEIEISSVRAILKSGLPVAPHQFLSEGASVRVLHGALEGLQGILVRSKSNYRVVVSVSMLQRSVAVEIDRSSLDLLEPIDDREELLGAAIMIDERACSDHSLEGRRGNRRLV